MQIELRRLKANHLYTEGQILINDLPTIPYAVEHTFTMLPIGQYHIRLTKDKKRRRVIGIFPVTPHKGGRACAEPVERRGGLHYFEAGHTYLSAKYHGTIVIGELLIPGSVKKGREHYDRLFDRIEKCQQRNEPITLTITDDCCEESKPAVHWLRASACHPTCPSWQFPSINLKNVTADD